MNVTIQRVDNERHYTQLMTRKALSLVDGEVGGDFNEAKEFTLDNDTYWVGVGIFTNGTAGNLQVKKNGTDILGTIMAISDKGFEAVVRVSDEYSVSVLITKD